MKLAASSVPPGLALRASLLNVCLDRQGEGLIKGRQVACISKKEKRIEQLPWDPGVQPCQQSFCLKESLPISSSKMMTQNEALEGHAICEGHIVFMQGSSSTFALLLMLLPRVGEALHVWLMSGDGASRRDLVAIIKLGFTFFVHAPPTEAAAITEKGPCL